MFRQSTSQAPETIAGTQSTYATNALNQYTEISSAEPNQQTAEPSNQPSSLQLSYDADGNATQVQTSTGTWNVEYNAENRPVRWTNAATGTVITMSFDSQGRRTEYKSVTNGAQNTWLRFLYDGYLCVQVLYSKEPHNVFKEFVWDPTESVATRPLAFRYAPNSLNLFYACDGDKNVSDVFYRMNSNGIGAHYDYAPFGGTTRTHSDSSASFDIVALNPFRFSSEYYDSELDLVYYNFRHYSPSLGRFLSRDPIEEQGGLNLYAFVGNRSLKRVDLLGTRVNSNSCVDISFTVSYSFRSKQVQVFPFLFMSVSGAFNFSAQGKLCKSCCRGKRIDRYEMGVSVSGDATLVATVGFAFSEDIDDIFSADIWGGIQAYGGGGISGTGIFSKDCAGTHGRGVGTLKGSAGLRVGAEVSFSIGRWSLGSTGVSGGGKSDVAVPFNFVCSERTCGDLSWGEASSDANLFLSACAFGICFEKTF